MTVDSSAARLARLNASLLAHGEDATLRRRIGATDTYVDVSVRIRSPVISTRPPAAQELAGDMKQLDLAFIMSPSEVTAAAALNLWPASAGGVVMPKIGDFLVSGGKTRKIEAVRPITVGDRIVRIEGRLVG